MLLWLNTSKEAGRQINNLGNCLAIFHSPLEAQEKLNTCLFTSNYHNQLANHFQVHHYQSQLNSLIQSWWITLLGVSSDESRCISDLSNLNILKRTLFCGYMIQEVIIWEVINWKCPITAMEFELFDPLLDITLL